MSFRFYTNLVSSTSRSIAAGIFTTGLVLIGFGIMIYLMPRLFAALAAAVFFIAGLSCVITAAKIFLVQRQLRKTDYENSGAYRQNVRIHIEEDFDA